MLFPVNTPVINTLPATGGKIKATVVGYHVLTSGEIEYILQESGTDTRFIAPTANVEVDYFTL